MHNNVSGRNFMNAETAKFTGAVLLVTEIYALLASLVTGLEYIFAMMFMNQFAYYASGKLLDGSKYIHLLTGIVYADGVAKDVVLVSAKLFVLVAVLDILYVFVKTKWLKHAKIKVFSENTVVMAFAVISSAAYSWNMLLELITLGQAHWPWARGRLTAGVVADLRSVPEVGKALLFFRNKKKASHS